MPAKIYDEPSVVALEEGHITVDGPDGVAVTMTPEAAEETGHRLIAHASQAVGRKRLDSGAEGEPASEEQAHADRA